MNCGGLAVNENSDYHSIDIDTVVHAIDVHKTFVQRRHDRLKCYVDPDRYSGRFNYRMVYILFRDMFSCYVSRL